MHSLRDITIIADKKRVLDKLRANKEEHAEIVKEAREGYIDKASESLAQRLGQLKEGRLVGLQFSLRVPVDHTEDYTTAITMLEYSTEDTVRLNAQQVRNFIEDHWDWKEEFIAANAAYSGKAAAIRDDRVVR